MGQIPLQDLRKNKTTFKLTTLSCVHERDCVAPYYKTPISLSFVILKNSKSSNRMTARLTCHEIPNGPVEDCSIVVAFFTQTDEILSSFGHLENIIHTVVYNQEPNQTCLHSQNAAFVEENTLNEHRNCSQTSSFPLYITGSRDMSEVGFQLTGETVRQHDTTFTHMKVVTSLQPCLTSWERHYKVCSTAAGGTSEASVCAQLRF